MKQTKITIALLLISFGSVVYAQEKEKTIGEVVLKGNKEYIVQKGDKISINVNQNVIASTSNAYDILLQSPGIVEQGETLSFRSKSVTVLINGRLSNLRGEELKNYLSSMQGNTIDKIEILQNPSSKYDAVGGVVINIKLVKNRKNGLNGSIANRVSFGKNVNHFPSLSLNYKNKGLNISTSYSYENSDKYRNTEINQSLSSDLKLYQDEKNDIENNSHQYNISVDYDFNERNSVGVFFRGMNKDNKISSLNKITLNDKGNLNLSEVKNNGKIDIQNPAMNVYYKSVLDSLNRKLNINADYFEYTKDQKYHFENTSSGTVSLLRNTSNSLNRVYSVSADIEYPSELGKFDFGVKGLFTKTDNDILWQDNIANHWQTNTGKSNQFIYKENVVAGYVSWDKYFGDHWQVNLGFRGEYTHSQGILIGGETNDRSYFNLFPSVSIQYLKNIQNVFNLSYRKSIQRFGFEVVNPFVRYQSDYSYYQGNPNIRPQIDHSINFTYTYNQNLTMGISETHSVDALGPLYVRDGDTTINTYTNFKSSDFYYVYVSWMKKFFNVWTSNLVGGVGGYKFNTSTDSYQSNNANDTWAYQVQSINQFSFNKGWSADFNLIYQSDIAFGIFKQKGYLSSNIGVAKRILANRANIKLSISDIFNTIKTDRIVDYNGVDLNQNRKQESRFISLAFTYKFGEGGSKSKKRKTDTIEELENRLKVEQ
ncbi:outer membrane beta-barrel family protein [Riemerella columbipharyngis]|uniref:Outer membrane receptor proteins, mostly Fe transport n=1 Tax=Riemerella columbipharyngis TaxID=1071918 RepID=A0A1G7FRE4_9FLAO|nr:outer membrane beta-barrel family protein [Riemerella columbipharyngis]SDE78471.1 Outer membrane receptor proteins, mostly Fe transport [Riemerella columbipharyngis]